MSRQDFHVMMPSLRRNRTFMPRYNLYITQPPPSCRNTIFMSRQDLCVTVLSSCCDRARPSSGAAGIRTPSLWECHHQRLLLFFGRFFWPQGEKQNLRQRRSLRKRKPGPGGGGGEEEGMWILGGNRGQFEAPPGILGSPPRTRPLFCCFVTQFRGAGGGGHEAGGAPRPIVGHRVVRCGSVRGVGGRGLALIQGAAKLQFWGRFERFWGNEGKVITCCLRRGSGRVATSWKAIATPPKPPPKTADFHPRQKEKQLALPPRRRRGLSRPQSYRISVKLTQKISRRHRGCRRGSGAKHFWDALVSFW